MKVTLIRPFGWCEGVANAINSLHKIISLHPQKQIYLIGKLVHNDITMQPFVKIAKIIPIEVANESIKKVRDKKAIIVLSAHGTDEKLMKNIRKKFIHVYDLTCRYVQNNKQILKKMAKNKKVIFYGNALHSECLAVKNLQNVYVCNDANKIIHKDFKYLLNQSTIPKEQVLHFAKKIKKITSRIKVINTTCKATQNRYDAIKKINRQDFLLVLGNRDSNNAREQVNLAKSLNISVRLIESFNDLQKIKFSQRQNIIVSSATSTSPFFVKEIVAKLKRIK